MRCVITIALLAALAASGRAQTQRLTVGGGTIDVTLHPGDLGVPWPDVARWVEDGARSVTAYLGRFPVQHVVISIRTDGCKGAHNGLTICGTPPRIRLTLGSQTTRDDLRTDEVMTHELVHLALPNVEPGRQGWVSEGLATYVEALARLSAARLSRDQFWLHLRKGLAGATGGAAEGGLDATSRLEQAYWSGALYWLLSDIEIRRQTGTRRSLADALRGIQAAGGSVSTYWDVNRVLSTGDRATGTHVLTSLHARMRAAPVRDDVAELLSRLGVRIEGTSVAYDDSAPLAAVRRSIEASGLQFTRR